MKNINIKCIVYILGNIILWF